MVKGVESERGATLGHKVVRKNRTEEEHLSAELSDEGVSDMEGGASPVEQTASAQVWKDAQVWRSKKAAGDMRVHKDSLHRVWSCFLS